MAIATVNRASQLRQRLDVTQKTMARLLGVTERTVIELEGGKRISEGVQRRLTEIDRLRRQLDRVVQAGTIGAWLAEPNDAFDGDAPADLIANGKVDLLWKMVFMLQSGVPS